MNSKTPNLVPAARASLPRIVIGTVVCFCRILIRLPSPGKGAAQLKTGACCSSHPLRLGLGGLGQSPVLARMSGEE